MNALALHVVSGSAVFTSIALTSLALLLSLGKGGAWRRGLMRLLFISGLLLALISSTAMPFALQLASLLLPFSLLVATLFEAAPKKLLIVLRAGVFASCLLVAAFELWSRRIPEVPAKGFALAYVVGDSVSAGIGFKGETTWPELVERRSGVKMVNLSRGGGTVGSALSQAKTISAPDALVFLEIGGNDMLGQTPLPKYKEDLDRLLSALEGRGRVLAMLELPWAPFHSSFCRAQREIAAKHGAILIPRRVFAWVLGGPEATVDGIHLSNAGHERMAEAFLSICGRALAKTR